MFDNVGAKLKNCAQIACWAGIVLSIISGVVLIASGDDSMVFTGILTMVVGSLGSWIGSLCVYGFGELVENSDIRTNIAAKQELEREQEKKNA